MGDNILRRLRNGAPQHKKIVLGNGEDSITVVVVMLSIDEMQMINEKVEEYAHINPNKMSDSVKQQMYNKLLAYNCMRDPSDPTLSTKIASSPAEVGECLDNEDISRICGAYGELIINKAPKLETLTQEELDIIKKHLEVTPLSDLSTVLLVHLKNCHQTIVSEI